MSSLLLPSSSTSVLLLPPSSSSHNILMCSRSLRTTDDQVQVETGFIRYFLDLSHLNYYVDLIIMVEVTDFFFFYIKSL